jgi:preprotein translocase subunit SecF
MYVVTHRKIFYAISGALIGLSVLALFGLGLEFGIDFKGGSLLEVAYPSGRPEVAEVRETIGVLSIPEFSVRATGEDGFIIRTSFLEEEARQGLLTALSDSGKTALTEVRFDSIGPTLGEELARKAFISIGLVILAIVLFITFAFRKVSEPVSSWKYGVITIVALVHDVIVPTGAFAALAALFGGFEVDTLFVTALLVILGFSVHDTIVVFDRVRENLSRNKEERKPAAFEEIVGRSIRQTFNRSINTSLTTLLAVLALFLLGPEAVRNFALVLLIGITAGTYSSIFLASPLLVTVERWQKP